MVVMDLKLDNLCAFRDFHVNFSYPKKIVNSYIENEHLEGLPNFRYKKVNIIMGSNATGKTSLGRLILSIFILIGKRNVEIITSYIADKDKKASFSMDFVNMDHDIYKLYRINAEFDPSESHDYSFENIKIRIESTDIKQRENYETCAKRLDSIMTGFTDANYITELEKLKNLSWLFSFPFDAFFETRYRIEESEEYLRVLNHTLKVLDPAIKGIIKLNELEDTYAILMGKEEILIKDGKILNPSMLSSGTKSGLDIAGIVASIKSDKHSFYYCDEKFSYVHSDIEKGYLSLMISLLKPNSQLFFTTHNLDILDLPLPKHSFNFLKKEMFEDDQVIKVINAADYLKKSTDSLRNAVDNDLFSVSPNLDLLYEIENL